MANAPVSNRILLVEDEDDLRDLLSEWLRAQGYDLTSAASAEEGLERLREESFDLLVTDYLLPGETGLELARAAIEEHLVAGPEQVIITSATPPRKEAAQLGIDVLQKPVALPSLVDGPTATSLRRLAEHPVGATLATAESSETHPEPHGTLSGGNRAP